jgi:hypothetical protein
MSYETIWDMHEGVSTLGIYKLYEGGYGYVTGPLAKARSITATVSSGLSTAATFTLQKAANLPANAATFVKNSAYYVAPDLTAATYGWYKGFILPIWRNPSHAYTAWSTTGNLLAAFHSGKATLISQEQIQQIGTNFFTWLATNVDGEKYDLSLDYVKGFSFQANDKSTLPSGLVLFQKILNTLYILGLKDISQISFLDLFSNQSAQDLEFLESAYTIATQGYEDAPKAYEEVTELFKFINADFVHELINLLLNVVQGNPVHNITESFKESIFIQIKELKLSPEVEEKIIRKLNVIFDKGILLLGQPDKRNIKDLFSIGIELLFSYDVIVNFLQVVRETSLTKSDDFLDKTDSLITTYLTKYQQLFGLNDKLLQPGIEFIHYLQQEIDKQLKPENVRMDPEANALPAASKIEPVAQVQSVAHVQPVPQAVVQPIALSDQAPSSFYKSLSGWTSGFIAPIITQPRKTYQAFKTAGKLMAALQDSFPKELARDIFEDYAEFLNKNFNREKYDIKIQVLAKNQLQYKIIHRKGQPLPQGIILLQKILNILGRLAIKDDNISVLDLFDSYEEDRNFLLAISELYNQGTADVVQAKKKYQEVKDALGLSKLDTHVFKELISLFLNIISNRPTGEITGRLKLEIISGIQKIANNDAEKANKLQAAVEAFFEENSNAPLSLSAAFKLLSVYDILLTGMRELSTPGINRAHAVGSFADEKLAFYKNFFGLKEDFLQTPTRLIQILREETAVYTAPDAIATKANAHIVAEHGKPATTAAQPAVSVAAIAPHNKVIKTEILHILNKQISELQARISPKLNPYASFRLMLGRKSTWQEKLNALKLIKVAVETQTIIRDEKGNLTVTKDITLTQDSKPKTWKKGEPLPFDEKVINDAGFSQKIGQKSGTEKAIESINQLLTGDKPVLPKPNF